jgi:hypothetical protein
MIINVFVKLFIEIKSIFFIKERSLIEDCTIYGINE